ncbi:YfiT family bacillithiol transferase [Emticicia sp. 21SJ11W-3]|uniref:YfiT family bacillithiol transferase n=1 Tax=Emticicia sp. 21SJ11W-3 TaxID=2916755 RepID=UPI00209D466F|nr:putative metal-dependent hydrolase [Emticicia sp. 21SJ11W-3]UTA69968.1 putative metal-dependent hydrolase [Emticicia sp. 21SJ11W-3]
MLTLEQLKYPIGDFVYGREYTLADTNAHIKVMEELPARLKALTAKLNDEELDTPYRQGGWTVRKVVHHMAESHIHMFTRIRFALTEQNPAIKGYDEGAWAQLPDHSLPIKPSLQILEGVHQRMVYLFRSLDEVSLKKTYYHGGYQKSFEIQEVIALYAWHSEHHYQHILQALGKR